MKNIVDLMLEPSSWAGLGLLATVLGNGSSGNPLIDFIALVAGGLAVGLRESGGWKS